MRFSEVALRYAHALYDLAHETGKEEKIFSEFKAVAEMLGKNEETVSFLNSPLISAADKESAMKKALSGSSLSEETRNFVLLLAKKDRLGLLLEIVSAYQQQVDERNNVTRGVVRSGAELSAGQKKELEDQIGKVTGKKVVLSYEVKTDLIGGLSAQVGSLTFDDTLFSHYRRMQEDLNRRTQ